MNNIFQKLKYNNHGNVLLITLMILTSILVVTLGVANLIIPNIAMNRSQSYSLKAYFASETGAERSLWALRKNNLNCAINNQCIDFSQNTCVDCLNPLTANILANGAAYSVEYASSTLVTLKSVGSYLGARRTLEIEVGAPPACDSNCDGKVCGDDGCGGSCGSCSSGEVCDAGSCILDCVSNCSGKVCGDDGCGGTCVPGCSTGQTCSNGVCVDNDVYGSWAWNYCQQCGPGIYFCIGYNGDDCDGNKNSEYSCVPGENKVCKDWKDFQASGLMSCARTDPYGILYITTETPTSWGERTITCNP